MKKKMALLLIALFAVLAAGTAVFLHAAHAGIKTLPPVMIGQDDARDMMRASLVYDAGTHTLRGTQTLHATNRTEKALHEAVLRLYMNGQSEGCTVVAGVTADGESVKVTPDPDDPTVLRVALDWQPGRTVTLSWTVMITVPDTDGASAVTLPALAMLEDGAWRTDAYDALAGMSYAQPFDYEICLIAPADTAAVFGGALVARHAETAADELAYTAQMRGARDASFALMPGGKVRSAMAGGVLLTAVGASSSQAGKLLSAAQNALSDLEKLGIAYPFDALTVAVSNDRPEDGAVRSGLLLSGDADKESLRRRMTRLIARQTFGIAVANDPWNAPWLSQSVASAVEMLCYRQRRGEAAYASRLEDEMEIAARITRPTGVSVGAGTAFFGSDGEMTQVLRDQGGAMLLGIERAVGEEAFLRALATYAQANAGQTGTREALEEALLAATGSDWRGYLEDELTF